MQLVYQQSLDFAAARRLNGLYRGDNFIVTVTAAVPLSPQNLTWVTDRFHGHNIDLGEQPPTTLNLAQALWAGFESQFAPGELCSLELAEEDGETISIDSTQTLVTIPAVFSAAHRTHAPRLTNAQNLALYGKCDNLNGHGHNYLVNVTTLPQADIRSDLNKLLAELDHKNLSLDIPELSGHNAVTEAVAALFARRLPHAVSVRVYETSDFYAEHVAGSSNYSLGRHYHAHWAYGHSGDITGNAFTIKLVVQGRLDPLTETAYDLGALDLTANGIFNQFHGKVFDSPMTDPGSASSPLYNLALYLWEQFQTKLGSALVSLQLSPNRTTNLRVSR